MFKYFLPFIWELFNKNKNKNELIWIKNLWIKKKIGKKKKKNFKALSDKTQVEVKILKII